jgi:hypothetical protein
MVYGLHFWSWTWHWSLYAWLFDFGFCIRLRIYMCLVFIAFWFHILLDIYHRLLFRIYKIYHVSPDSHLSIDHSDHILRVDFNPSMCPSRNQLLPIGLSKGQACCQVPKSSYPPFVICYLPAAFPSRSMPMTLFMQRYMADVSVTIPYLQWLESVLPFQAHKAF